MLGMFAPRSFDNSLFFYAPLKTTLAPSIGSYVPTFTRNTTASVTDFEGIVRTAKIGEARFEGARRVENLYVDSETLVTQGVSVAAGTYTVSFVGTGTITFSGAYSGSLVGTGASNRVEATFSASTGLLTSTVSGSVLMAQCEDVTGQSVQTASEYVSNGVLPYPYHGTGADGVKCFATTLDGTPIADSVLKGYFSEGQRTNLALYSNDFSNAAWTKSNLTQSSGTITATAANGTLLQTVTSTSQVHTFSIQIKRKTGTGDISLTLDNGATWTTKTISATWTRYEVTQTLANPVFGILIATGGDEIDIRHSQLEAADFSSSPILTTSASTSRNSEFLTYDWGLPEIGSVAAEVWTETDKVTFGRGVSKPDGKTPLNIQFGNTLASYDGGVSNELSSGGTFGTGIRKIACRWNNITATRSLAKDGATSPIVAYNGAFSGGGTVNFGSSGLPGIYSSLFGTMKNVKAWDLAMTDTGMVTITS